MVIKWFDMKIEYSADVDALYIRLKDTRIEDTEDIAEGITIDLDSKNNIVGIEILDAKERVDLSNIDLIEKATEAVKVKMDTKKLTTLGNINS